MPQYLVAIDLPDDYDPSVETEATIEGITRKRELTRSYAAGSHPEGKGEEQ